MHIQDKLLCKLCLPASEHVIFTILLPVTILLTLMLFVILTLLEWQAMIQPNIVRRDTTFFNQCDN